MKNKIFSILIVFFALSVCLFTLTACRDKDMCTNGSVHAYGQWVSNGDGTHTRVCAYDFSHTETLKCGGGIATCTEKAVCAICLQPYGEIKEHNIVIDELVEPTCSQTGLTLGFHCEDCGEIFVEQEVIKTIPHTFEDSNQCSYCGASPLIFEINDTGTAYTVTGGDASFNVAEIIIPAYFNDKPVTCIGECAFYGFINLTSIVIPNSITAIGDYAFFGCTNLTSVNYTGTIEQWAGITFTHYTSNPLYYSGALKINNEVVTEVDLSNATIISDGAFLCCGAITSVVLPNNITNIGDATFAYCGSLTSITIPDSVTKIGDAAFAYCSSLSNITIPDSVTKIGDAAFAYCSTLSNITIPDSVTKIGDAAFAYCDGLASIAIPDSVTFIGDAVFYGCSGMEEITLPFVVTNKKATNNAHFGQLFGAQSYVDNNSYVPTSLKKVTIIGGSTIPHYAFRNCGSLVSVVIGDSITSIGSRAFQNCSSLANIVIPDSVTAIGSSAFQNCSSLTNIVIPDSVTAIGSSAFQNCSSLKYNIKGNLKYLGNANNPYLYLAGVTTTDITTTSIDKNCKVIGSCAFYECRSITNICIPDSVISISDSAFQYCSGLTSVTIGNSVISIGDYAFYWCSGLTSIKYRGTESQWGKISKGVKWDSNTGSYKITYNYDGE